MRIVLDLEGQQQTIDLTGWQPQATLAQLLTHAGYIDIAVDSVLVNGKSFATDTELSEVTLLEGSLITRKPQTPTQRISSWNVSIAAGKEVGSVVVLPQHRTVIVGRAPQSDLVLPTESASWQHCTLRIEEDGVRVQDAESTNGTYLFGQRVDGDGVLVTEAATIVVGGAVLNLFPTLEESQAPAPGSLRNLTAVATAPFNRPPRPGIPDRPEPLIPPSHKDIPPASKFSIITIIAPLILAAAMVLVLGNPKYAMFAALSPIMAVGMWFEQKQRRAKNLKEEEARYAQALIDFKAEIADAGSQEIQRRHELIPSPALVLRRPSLPSTFLWQRRNDAKDFLALHAGTGDIPWNPDIEKHGSTRLEPEVKEILDKSFLVAAPVLVDITNAGVIGIVGDRDGALALARSFVIQAAVHCGPADLTIGVFCDKGRQDDWEWASWLPHTAQAGNSQGARWMSNGRENSTRMVRFLHDNIEGLPTPSLFVVLDSDVLTEGRDAPARDLLGLGRRTSSTPARPGELPARAAGIVIASTADKLPASCTTVIDVGTDSSMTVTHPEDLTVIKEAILAGVSIEDAQRCAMTLAHFDDPELIVPGASLPSLVRLSELLGTQTLDADTISHLWQTSTGISTPIGLSESGTLSLDIVKDGPHGLVGGTTGSGKSEFLRSLVAGLAARNDPTKLSFILIDFKGGAAFKACERLPHTIGTISNLDEQLADRALRALEAEMERRQRLFAQAGEDVDNLSAYLATNPAEPLPRVLLVIDEFAMLAKDFPDVLASLVSVGAVGRTLGIHMILATQRPAGVVNEDILANTNLRVALRVQSREDSSNVIGVPLASAIGREQAGRAYVKLGQDDITAVQTALVTGQIQEDDSQLIELRAVGLFGVPAPAQRQAPGRATDANELDLLITAIVGANEKAGIAPPRQVWPEALGERVTLAGFHQEQKEDAFLPTVGGVDKNQILIALADEPDLQRQSPAGWDLSQGNLLLMGIAGSGTSTTLATIALNVAKSYAPEDIDIVCLDMGSRGLSPLEGLPHTAAYVGAGSGSRELQMRFLRFLLTELNQRRESTGPHKPLIVLIDGLAALRDEFQDYEGQQLLDAFYRVYADGPSVGISFAVSTTRAKAIPSAIDEVTTQKWLFRLADSYDYAALGVRGKNIPAVVPGRCVSSTTLLQMHVATPDMGFIDAVAQVADQWAHAAPKSAAIGALPEYVTGQDIGLVPDLSGEPWQIPIGLREDTLDPAFLELYEGEHVLIAGPARSGKSSILLALLESFGSVPAEHRPALWGIYDRRSPLGSAPLDRGAPTAEDIPALVASLRLEKGPVILMIDDAERFEDADQSIANLISSNLPGLVIIATGRSADLRTLYSHWSKTVRKARCGVLLQPDVDYDGELLGLTLPRRAPVAMVQGRGYACVGGTATLIQSISPTHAS